MLTAIAIRGPDCFGYEIWGRQHDLVSNRASPFELLTSVKISEHIDQAVREIDLPDRYYHQIVCLVNFRGIPTTEDYGQDEETIQPFNGKGVHVVHNGLLHNDKQMYAHYQWPQLTKKEADIDSYAFCHIFNRHAGEAVQMLKEVQGSYALAAFEPGAGRLWLARNFRGLFIASDNSTQGTMWFASEAEALAGVTDYVPWELPLDSAIYFDLLYDRYSSKTEKSPKRMRDFLTNLKPDPYHDSCVVVLSGGLDSTVCATWAAQRYNKVHLLHFQYGCRAEKQEEKAFFDIVHYLQENYPSCSLSASIEGLDFIKELGGSTLTDHTLQVANGEEGVETDHEWVPARNVVMIAMAAAYCDRHEFRDIILGLNMEEGSVYSDNSIEFYKRMQEALAIGAKSAPKMTMPLGNLMKRHILKLGLKLNAPLHLSWSCYHGGALRCGTCGPCVMRRSAFRANNLEDMVAYQE